MDRGAWWTTALSCQESGPTEQLTLSLYSPERLGLICVFPLVLNSLVITQQELPQAEQIIPEPSLN